MSGIAELMHKIGYTVLGSDSNESENVKRLRDIGIIVKIGHSRKNLQHVNAVVFSSAINQNNPEIKEAKKKQIPIVSRADMLGELMRNKKCIAIAVRMEKPQQQVWLVIFWNLVSLILLI